MAGEIQFTDATGGTDYVVLLNGTGKFRRTDSGAFETYAEANFAQYAHPAAEQGTSGIYLADAPAGLAAAGVVAKRRAGPAPAPSDPIVSAGNWAPVAAALGPPASLAGCATPGPAPLTGAPPPAAVPVGGCFG